MFFIMFIEGEKQNKAKSRKQKVESGKQKTEEHKPKQEQQERQQKKTKTTKSRVQSKAADLHVVPAAAAADVAHDDAACC